MQLNFNWVFFSKKKIVRSATNAARSIVWFKCSHLIPLSLSFLSFVTFLFMAIISTLISETSLSSLLYKAFVFLTTYYVIHLLSQFVSNMKPFKPNDWFFYSLNQKIQRRYL